MLPSKLKTLFWYLRHPSYYKELVRKVAGMRVTTAATVKRAAEDKERGRDWCKAHCMEPADVVARLQLPPLVLLADLHADRLRDAQAAVDACPVKMGGPANLDLLYHVVRHLPAERVVETGVANGWSTLAVRLAQKEQGRGQLVSVDMPYAKMNNEAWVGCAVPPDLRDGWTLIRRPDADGLPGAIAQLGQLDLAHHDSDKSYAGRMFAYHAMWSALRDGGVLVSDDVEDNAAFADFAREVGREPWVVQKKPGNYAGVLLR